MICIFKVNYLPKENGETTELDVIFLHESGVYVFDLKNYNGRIFGTETQQYWAQSLPTGRERSQNSHCFLCRKKASEHALTHVPRLPVHRQGLEPWTP